MLVVVVLTALVLVHFPRCQGRNIIATQCVHVTGFAKTVPIGTTIEIHFMA